MAMSHPRSPSAFSRRHFLGTAGLAGLSLAGSLPAAAPRIQFCTFTKFLQHLTFEQLAAALAPLGLDGIEAPVRPRGHIEPEQVPSELPRLVEALRARNLSILCLTSGINQVSADQHTESVLRNAAKLGIPRYRMNYYKYDLSKPIRPQLEDFRAQLRDLVALNRELGIQAVYQNHSGSNFVGAPIWDIYDLVREHDPRYAALAFDIGHATVEGGLSWEIDFALVQSHLGMIYVKDAAWLDRKRIYVPLGEGTVNPSFFKRVQSLPSIPPVSLHVEYLPEEKNPGEATTRTHLDAIGRDLAKLKGLLGIA